MATDPETIGCLAPKNQSVDLVVDMARSILSALAPYFEGDSPPPPVLQMYAIAGAVAFLHQDVEPAKLAKVMQAFAELTLRTHDLNTRSKAHTDATTARH